MNKTLLLTFLFAAICLFSCNSNKSNNETKPSVELNDSTVTVFAQNIARSIIHGNADILNNAFDEEHLKDIISENSIVYSSFDIPEGQSYFKAGLEQGTLAVEAVNNGGDFAFVKHYIEDGKHHIIFRTYNDFNLSFADYIVDTVNGKIKIQDGFMYHTGSTLSENLESGMLYNLLLQTNPSGETQNLNKAEILTQNGHHKEAMKILKDHKAELKDYRLYWQLYIANLYKTDSKHFIANLDALAEDSLDIRYVLLHKLLYYFNAGEPKEVEAVVDQLIPYSGDDPIYLLFLGKSLIYDHQFQQALDLLTIADNAMPLLWDLWYSELECHRELNNRIDFESCLQRGQNAYGMTKMELDEIAKQFWGDKK